MSETVAKEQVARLQKAIQVWEECIPDHNLRKGYGSMNRAQKMSLLGFVAMSTSALLAYFVLPALSTIFSFAAGLAFMLALWSWAAS